MQKKPGGRKNGKYLKGEPHVQLPFVFGFFPELLLYDRTGRARSSAGTAAEARIRVDLVLILTLADSAYRALTGASAALNATVIDNKCHCKILLSRSSECIFRTHRIQCTSYFRGMQVKK